MSIRIEEDQRYNELNVWRLHGDVMARRDVTAEVMSMEEEEMLWQHQINCDKSKRMMMNDRLTLSNKHGNTSIW